MREIPLTQGKVALVDDADFEKVMAVSRRWHALYTGWGFYAACAIRLEGKHKNVYLHRIITEPLPGMQVDHADGNGLNNQRANLRICTASMNLCNRRNNPNKHGYRGVRRRVRRDGIAWDAAVKTNRKFVWSCGHPTVEAAARAYDALARQHHGEFARLNFPDEQPVTA